MTETDWSFVGLSPSGEPLLLSSLPLPQLPLPSVAAALQVMLSLGLNLNISQLKSILVETSLPGRYQRVVYCQRQLILDVAHNPAATAYLAEKLKSDSVDGENWCVVAMMADKDCRGALASLASSVDHWLVASLPMAPRAALAQALAADVVAVGASPKVFDTVEQALQLAVDSSSPNDRILVAGSFFTVAEALKLIKDGSK